MIDASYQPPPPGPYTECCNLTLHRCIQFGVNAKKHDVRALPGEKECGFQPYSCIATGDQKRLACQAVLFCSLLWHRSALQEMAGIEIRTIECAHHRSTIGGSRVGGGQRRIRRHVRDPERHERLDDEDGAECVDTHAARHIERGAFTKLAMAPLHMAIAEYPGIGSLSK
jgi:hypothetical protein